MFPSAPRVRSLSPETAPPAAADSSANGPAWVPAAPLAQAVQGGQPRAPAGPNDALKAPVAFTTRPGSPSSSAPPPHDGMRWVDVEDAFVDDNTLGYIYVLGTTAEDYRSVISALEASAYEVEFVRDSISVPGLTRSVESLLHPDSEENLFVRVKIDLNYLHLHFFSDATMCFDFDWFDIRDQTDLDLFAGFMSFLSQVTGKSVEVEGGLFTCDAATQGIMRGPFFPGATA